MYAGFMLLAPRARLCSPEPAPYLNASYTTYLQSLSRLPTQLTCITYLVTLPYPASTGLTIGERQLDHLRRRAELCDGHEIC